MTDDRPRPKYGEYAPVPPAPVAPPPAAPPVVDESASRSRNTRDTIATTVLLLLGVWDVASSFPMYAQFGVLLGAAYEQQGYGDFTAVELATQYGMILNVVRIAILAIVLVVSLILLARRRVAFWVPLAGGVLAAILVVVFVAIILANEPGFAEYVKNLQG